MKLLFVRHAKATDRLKALLSEVADADRPLTKKGKQKFREFTAKNATLFQDVEVFATSPYLRARQTLDVILENLTPAKRRKVKIETLNFITPDDDAEKFLLWLKKQSVKTLLVVGHEPFISNLLAIRVKNPPEKIKKGSILVLEVENAAFQLKSIKNIKDDAE